MITYVYETIPSKEGEEVKHYEIRQSIKDEALKTHPETGEKIRRVVLGGYGVTKSEKGGSSSAAPQGGCGPSCGCHH